MGYSKRQIYNAERVGAYSKTIGNPLDNDLITLVRYGAIIYYPITGEDVDTYFKTYMYSRGNHQEKTRYTIYC